MEKIDRSEIIMILIIIILGIFIALNIFKNDKVTFIDGHDYLYENAIDYLLKSDNNPDKNKANYKMFVTYRGFGTAEDNKNIYAYMWIVSESYYIENNKLKKSGSNSMPYKFIFEKSTEKLKKYEITEDGNLRNISIKNMFPKSIQNEIINYNDESDLEGEINNYYNSILN